MLKKQRNALPHNGVCDIRSWPGGFQLAEKGKGGKGDWANYKTEFGFADDASAIEKSTRPTDQFLAAIQAGVDPCEHFDFDTRSVDLEPTRKTDGLPPALSGYHSGQCAFRRVGVGMVPGTLEHFVEFKYHPLAACETPEQTMIYQQSTDNQLQGICFLREAPERANGRPKSGWPSG